MDRHRPLLSATLPSKLRFRHLQLLELLGRTHNLRAAAEQMHVTQPAATKILGDIETMFGERLFERLPREMRPTDLGLLAIRYASSAMSGLGKFANEFVTQQGGGYGHLTVGAISASAAQIVIAAIREIQARRPRLVIKLVEQSSDQLAIWLEHKQLDLMIGRLTEPRQRAIFDAVELSDEPVCFVVGSHHPLLRARRVDIADLGHWPWILYPSATAIRQLFEETFASAGLVAPVGMVETPSIFSTIELLRSTEMISLQPRAVVQQRIDEGLLGCLPIEVRRSMSHYSVITRKNELPSPQMEEFVAILRQRAAG
ncbi:MULTISPECIES: LysR family transcriptional regulator [unclassified Burkholderia]|uniref:LysR family transcriptional regulator n=1 Tax=unclassified Burkholderia TaxID=2613784 RepID=UPI000469AE3F|nr:MULTISPECIES: LysR family transcriptional regulator [unclassified Burkholderia]NIF71474.1 LysR family transcriptional regulator [Burkholderia sp. Ap-962]NIF90738.1 LysR family transcriptional regulator [Burkholderia sp. Cy-637]